MLNQRNKLRNKFWRNFSNFKRNYKAWCGGTENQISFLYTMRSVKVRCCCVDSIHNTNKGWENVYFCCEKLKSWPQPFARWKRGKTSNLLIIYHLSLPLKYEHNTRCYITRQHGWNENIRRQPLGIARPCINAGTACCIYRNLQTILCEYLCSRVKEVNKNIWFG